MTATVAQSLRQDARIIGVVGLAHGTSHFFQLLVPPLFPWLMEAFSLDFTTIGLALSVFYLVSGVGQAIAGFVVDRFGPVRVLTLGMLCFLLSAISLALAGGLPGIMLATALAGLGNSVLHPCDFTILNREVSSERLGHAFSAHGLLGNVGYALAPIFLTTLATFAGWRVAAGATVLLVLPAMALLWIFRADLERTRTHKTHAESSGGRLAFLSSGAVWLCFAFFFLITIAFGAIQTYMPSVLQGLYQLPLALSAVSLSIYLLASGGGMLVGGFVARKAAHDHQIAAALTTAALFAMLLSTTWVPGAWVPPLLAVIGFCSGLAGPSRDLLVRKAATARFGQAAFGRVYGFVYSGLDLGMALAPPLFGMLMDRGRLVEVLIGIAIFQGLAILTALNVGKSVRC